MELAGAFLIMVAPRPWNGPLSPFTWNAVFTLPRTPVKAAAKEESTSSTPSVVLLFSRPCLCDVWTHALGRAYGLARRLAT